MNRRRGTRTGPIRGALAGLLIAGLCAASVAQEAAKPAEAPKADAARPEVGKPIQAARELIQAKKYKEALKTYNTSFAIQAKKHGKKHIDYCVVATGVVAAEAGRTNTVSTVCR